MAAVPSTGPAAAPFSPRHEAPEAAATRHLYERYSRQISAFCAQRLGNRDEAEDAMQSTFLNAFRGLQRGVSPEYELAWLHKIADNVCLTRKRSFSRRRRLETPGDLDAIQDVLPARERDADELIRLSDALEWMPEQQRRALLLREWQGLSYKEIGQELDLSQAAVETLLFRARRSLARGLTEEQPPKARSTISRLRAHGDLGSFVAVLKSLLFGGGVKIAATVATVAATSVVATTPPVGHDIAEFITQSAQPVAVAQAKPAHKAAVPAKPVRAAAAPVRVEHAKAQLVVYRTTHKHAANLVAGERNDKTARTGHENRGSDGTAVAAPVHVKHAKARPVVYRTAHEKTAKHPRALAAAHANKRAHGHESQHGFAAAPGRHNSHGDKTHAARHEKSSKRN
jgi:RNA polymerase sigma-70 factor (ECF subfamily)